MAGGKICKAILDSWPDSDLRAGKQLLNSLCQQVRSSAAGFLAPHRRDW